MRIFPFLAGPILAATAAFVAAESVDDIIEAARSDCQSLENGQFHQDPEAVVSIDLNGDGMADTLVDTSRFSCSSSASLFAANGGSELHALVNGKTFSWQALGWRVVPWEDDTILLLARHGSYCGGYGYQRCYEAIAFSEDQATSISQDSLTTDSVGKAAENPE